MKSLLGIAAFTLAAACPLALDGRGAASTAGAVAEPTITLVHQELALAVDAHLVVEFKSSTPIGDGSIRVLTYQSVTNREALGRAIEGRFGGASDRVDLTADAILADGAGNVKITVPTASDATPEDTLGFPTPGLYPVAVQLLGADGDVVSQLVTFVNRLPPAGGDPPASISVALLATITAPPQLPGAQTPLPADVAAALAELGRYPAGLPISLDISPEVIARLDAETRANLAAVMSNGVIMSQPVFPFDPSAAAAAGLGEEFTDRLVDGESVIAESGLATRPVTRTVWYATGGITDAGAQMLRELNVRLLVIPSAVYLRAEGNNGALTDYSQLFQSVIGTAADSAIDTGTTEPPIADDGSQCAESSAGCLPTATIDPALSARLVDANLSDEQAAMYTAADIVTYRDFFAQSMSANSRHALVLGLDGGGVANAARIRRAVEMTTAVGAANFITIDQLEENSSQAIADGRQLELHLPLPEPAPIDLIDRARSIDVLELTIPTVESMLVNVDGRTQRWDDTVDMLYSTSLTDADVRAAVDSINAEMTQIKECITQPTAYSFTLNGRSANVPLRLTNNCPEPLRVIVQLSAAAGKMDVPEVGTNLELLANTTTELKIPVTTRTNGTFDVTLDVYTPVGRIPITQRVTLRARVNSLTGLPQVITGVALLLLLTWWARTLRRSRRAKRSMVVVATHPSAGG